MCVFVVEEEPMQKAEKNPESCHRLSSSPHLATSLLWLPTDKPPSA